MAGIYLDLICRIKIHQAVLCNHLSQMISCYRNHAIRRNGSVIRNADIRCSCAYINQSQIQHSEFLRNGNHDGCNWLQCQIDDLKICSFTGLIQTIHYIIRQKCCNQIYRNLSCFMSFQIGNLISVQIVMHRRITDQIELHIRSVTLQKLRICFLNRLGIKIIDIFIRNLVPFRIFFFVSCLNGMQYTTCSCNTYICQMYIRIPLQHLCHVSYGHSDLTDIMNLSVQHRTCFVFLHLLCDNVEFAGFHIAHGSYYTSGTDIQTENNPFFTLFQTRHRYIPPIPCQSEDMHPKVIRCYRSQCRNVF